ncbi:hypothetical protein BD413DRAFT_223646 [Trametes elegans]|nr:hypothetical protein BD413DRAFT_223646 [Trametes elegans]
MRCALRRRFSESLPCHTFSAHQASSFIHLRVIRVMSICAAVLDLRKPRKPVRPDGRFEWSAPPLGPPPFLLPAPDCWAESQEQCRKFQARGLQPQINFIPTSVYTPITVRELWEDVEHSMEYRGVVDSDRVLFTQKDKIYISVIWPGYGIYNESLRVGPNHEPWKGVRTMGQLAHAVGVIFYQFLLNIEHQMNAAGTSRDWSISENPCLFNADTICVRGVRRMVDKVYQVLVEIIPQPQANATHRSRY